MTRIAILVTDGCFGSNVYGIADAFGCASGGAKYAGLDFDFETVMVSMDGKPVRSINGHLLHVDHSIMDAPSPDVIIVLFSLPNDADNLFIDTKMTEMADILDWLKRESGRGTLIASNCTGSFVLAETGLLDGQRATTHWQWATVFEERYPAVELESRNMVIDNGKTVCGAGSTAFVDLTLHFIRRFGTEELAVQSAHNLVVDPNRNLQAPYALMSFKTGHRDQVVEKAQHYIADNVSSEITARDLADQLNVSERTLMRRFKAATGWPLGSYIQGVRIDLARSRLATSQQPLQAIVGEVGYEDFSSFSRLFKKRTGLTMQSYRERFSPIMAEA